MSPLTLSATAAALASPPPLPSSTLLDPQHTFASFLSRDTTYDLIGNIWRMVHPVIPLSAALPDALSTSTSRTGGVGGVGEHHAHLQDPSDDEGSGGSPGVAPATAAVVGASGVEVAQSSEGVGSRAKRRLKGLRRPRGATGESAPGGKGLGEGGGGAGGRGGDARASVEGGGGSGGGENGGAGNGVGEGTDGPGGKKKKKGGGGATTPPHAPTVDTCPTLKGLKEVCMDAQFPGAPEKIYNLMFTSGFMKGFWSENQKLTGACRSLSFARFFGGTDASRISPPRVQRSRSATGRPKPRARTSSRAPCRTSSPSTAQSARGRPSASSRTRAPTSTLTTLCAS